MSAAPASGPEQLAKKLIARARRKGARQAEAFVEVGRQSSCRVRDGQIEDLTQATSKGVGLRVVKDRRLGFAYTSDFQPASLDAFVDRALALAEAAAPNPLNGLPLRKDLGTPAPPEHLFDPAVADLDSEWKIKTALEVERAGRAVDPRVATFDSVGAGEHVLETFVASSEGAAAGFSGTYVYLYAVPVASDGTQRQTAYWSDYKRYLADLDSPEAVGKEAARRALRMLGARKVKSQVVPVVFDPSMAGSFITAVAAAASGDAVYKKSSVFAPLLGKQVAAERVTVVDDGLLDRGIGTSPVDGEGVATRVTPIVERGVLKHFLYDSFTARKAKARTTGNAARGYASLPHIGVNNLRLEPGTAKPEEIIRGVKQGLYVTAMLGRGADIVTGDYSRGANGLWIENGELAFPVQEVTVAGNLLQMLRSIDAIGDDLQFRSSVLAPTIRFAELTVAGQ
ncbi:MAG TPA: TldD/PmbA family protein [Myxococcales bacterium]|nr:TldD/PmbA family protein [Myxococcales bacterium]